MKPLLKMLKIHFLLLLDRNNYVWALWFIVISIWWKSYVLSLTTAHVWHLQYTITKILQAFHPNSMTLKNGYHESCFCGFTMWCNRRIWFMLLFSLCTCSVSYFYLFIFLTDMERNRSNTWILFTKTCVREKKMNILKTNVTTVMDFCCCYWNLLCKENSNKVLWNWPSKTDTGEVRTNERVFKVSGATKRATTQFNKCQI